MEETVAIVECPNYDPQAVQYAVGRLVDLLGGWNTFIKPGERILIKPNLLMKKAPEEAVTTHPSVVSAVADGIIKAGGGAVIADSPGGLFNIRALQKVYQGCGIAEAAARTGAELNFNTREASVRVPDGGMLAGLTVMEAAARADGVISVSKLKTHGLTILTGAVKNLFGVIPGLKKAEYHVCMPGVKEFSAMLVDVARAIAPRLHLMDAVTGMEGDGPSAGSPVHVGMLLASTSPFALDCVAAVLVGTNPLDIPSTSEAVRRGYTSGDIKSIRLLGDHVSFPIVRFRLPPRPVDMDLIRSNTRLPGWLVDSFNRRLRPWPVFAQEICRGCGECVRVCPPQAIKMEGKIPRSDLEKCIRCFCCQELCPQKAVRIKRPWLGRLLFK